MTHFFRNGNRYTVAANDAVNVTEVLPAGNYVLKKCPNTGLYLESSEPFTEPPKIYGDCLKNAERILSTYLHRGKNTGVLLVGEKGSGKTLLLREVCNKSNLPVVIINEPFTGDNFNSFLSYITQKCIVVFDEFEKTYDSEDQERVLTLLDGTYQSNKLFLITSNNKWSLNDNMQNRPGRIFYLLEFNGVEEEFIREYCYDNLFDRERTEEVVETSYQFSKFNFDMLCALVEEINRYGDSIKEVLKILNVKSFFDGELEYVYEAKIGEVILMPYTANDTCEFNPFCEKTNLLYAFCWKEKPSIDDPLFRSFISKNSKLGVTAESLQELQTAGRGFYGEIESEEYYENRRHYSIELTPGRIVSKNRNQVVYNANGIEVTLTRKS